MENGSDIPNEPLISIIVPLYNTSEPLIRRCLDSIRDQTYVSREVIVVNDGSKKDYSDILADYPEVICISHEKNRGLFRARVTGVQNSHGKYIAFVDSDDCISRDFFRTLICAAEENGTEIVAGNTIFENTNGDRFVRSLHEMVFPDVRITDDEVRGLFFGQQGTCFAWHTVWNKIYSSELWARCIEFFDSVSDNIVMTEDVLFSSILFYNARSFRYICNEGYHYCENAKSSTANSVADFGKYSRNMASMTRAFNSVSEYLESNGAAQCYVDDFARFRELYSRMWRSYQVAKFDGTVHAEESQALIDEFYPGYNCLSDEKDHFFELSKTKYDPTVENIKDIILDPEKKVVTFDIFDTLVIRDVLSPEDVFSLMENHAATMGYAHFSTIRQRAETELRSKWWTIDKTREDFTLSDIYNFMVSDYGFTEEAASELKKLENDTEKKICRQRKAVKSLFDLAMYLHKRVIIVSDMYLEKETVEDILRNCGYEGYEKLFLSSDMGHTKYSGNLFRDAISYCGEKPPHIVHLGDNWNNDFVKSRSLGIIPVLIPKTIDLFKGKIQNVKTNSLGYLAESVLDKHLDRRVENSFGYRAMEKMVADRFFDDPYPTYNPESDFNCSPKLIGYYPVGMHLMGISRWIFERAVESGSENIVFLSRDGYLPKMAFEIYQSYQKRQFETSYVACSRRCLLPWMVDGVSDLLDLPIEIRNHSPRSIVSLLEFCLDSADGVKELSDEKFKSFEEYREMIVELCKKTFSLEKLNVAKKLARDYYQANVPEGALIFDMGYSGRLASAMVRALGYNIRFLYIYKQEKSVESYESIYGLEIDTLYPVAPVASGFFREYLLSESAGGCIGFESVGGVPEPVFDTKAQISLNSSMLSMIQRNALDFVKDYCSRFAEVPIAFMFNEYEVSLAFESLIVAIKDADRYVFKNSSEDDTSYGGSKSVSVYNLWAWFLSDYYHDNVITKEESKNPPLVEKPFVHKSLNKYYGKLKKLMRIAKTKVQE